MAQNENSATTLKEWARRLDGRDYRRELTQAEEVQAKKANVVVAFGHSDDLLEFRGAWDDEQGAWNGGTFRLDSKGNIREENDHDIFVTIRMEWSPAGSKLSWRISVLDKDVSFETFVIMEDGEPYCQGIVFMLPPKC